MPVILHDGCLTFVRLELAPSELAGLLARHRTQWQPPERLEGMAAKLVADNFPEGDAATFCVSVIKWGRGDRFAGRFVARNTPEQIATALREATALVDNGLCPEAVTRVQQLGQLGQSFASKIVRFIRPRHAVIMDSVIRNSLGYSETEAGYGAFLSDCLAILDAVKDKFPHWRVCEIEAAIFAKIKGY